MATAFINDVKSLQTLTDHTSDVNSVDFGTDCVLVTGSGDKRVRVWEWRRSTGYAELDFSPLLGHKYGVTCVRISPHSTMLATSSIDGTTLLWNLRTGARVYTMAQVGGEAVRVARFSPDSTLLVTAGDNGQVCLWDLVRRTLIRCFTKHEGAIQSVCFSADASILITTCTLGVLNLFATADLIDRCSEKEAAISAIASVDDAHDLGVVSSDFSSVQHIACNDPYTKLYRLVTCGNDHLVKLWEISVVHGKCEAESSTARINLCRVMEKHSSALTCVRFSVNGFYIASTGLDKTTIIWEAETGNIVTTLFGHNRYVACCAFSRDGNLLATGSNDKSVIIWDLTGGSLSLDSELAKQRITPKFASSPDNGVERGLEYERELMLNAESLSSEVKLIQRLDHRLAVVNSVAFHGNRLLASASGDKLVRVWCLEPEVGLDLPEAGESFREKEFSPLEGHKYSVNHVEFSPCGAMLASCSLDGTAIIWDVELGGNAKGGSFVNAGYGIRVCRWSPDGSKIATAGDDEKTTLWDVNTMKELGVFAGHSDAVNAIAFTYDSRYLVTACNEGTWRLYDTDYERENSSSPLITCEEAHDLGVQGCDFSPTAQSVTSRPNDRDDVYLLASCGNDSLVKLWEITVPGRKETPEASENDDQGKESLEDSMGNRVSVLHQQKKCLTGHGGNVIEVRFSPVHGEILASVATDKTARIWNVLSTACLCVLENHESFVTTCAFSEDSSLFATGGLDKSVLIWKIPRFLFTESLLIDNLRGHRKRLPEWNVDDTLKWLNEIGLPNLAKNARTCSMTGRELLFRSEQELLSRLRIGQNQEMVEEFRRQVYWLKRGYLDSTTTGKVADEATEIPHEFLCPVTHEIMREPVRCSDGFTYERAAISEWFLCGKYTSPMTNEPLRDTSLVLNVPLRNDIFTFIYGNGP